ncbi:synaptosomal-associated protein 25 [Trichonephila clavipes]|nr:synaptosomal-associated protein 25 [Trichonephila clavipes]
MEILSLFPVIGHSITVQFFRSSDFKEDASTWKASEDGKIVNNQPARVMDDRNGAGPMGGYIAKITNDAREEEMEDNMQQVSTMIGNLRNMAIDMGSEMESQNRQLDRINLKSINGLYDARFTVWVSEAVDLR